MPQHLFPTLVRRVCRPLVLVTVLAVHPLSAGTISTEYDVDDYDAANTTTPFTLSIPTRNGTPIEKIRAVVIYAPGVTSNPVSGPVNNRWAKWLHANEAAFLDIGDDYKAPSYILEVLSGFASPTGYPELDNVPVMIYGESAGGSTSFYMAMHYPERTIAFVVEHTQYWDYPIPDAMKLVPGYFRWGEFDYDRWSNGYYDIDGDNLKDKMNEGAQWMCLSEDRQTHASMRYAVEEAMGYFSLMLPLRYTYQEGVAGHDPKLGAVTLNTIEREDGYLGEINMGAVQTPRYDLMTNLLKDWESLDPYTAPYVTAERNDKLEHCWMPDAKTAAFWATKASNGEHDLDIRYLDTLETDYGTETYNNRSGYFPNLFTTDQQVRIEIAASDFPDIREVQFWMDDQLVATDTTPPYGHAYTFTEQQIGVHFIYPVAIAENGRRCVGRRRVLQVYSNTYDGNTSPLVSDIEHFTGRPGETVEIPFTVDDAETDPASLSATWRHVDCTDDFASTDYTAAITGSGADRVLSMTLPETPGIIWGIVQVSDGDMSVNEYVQIRVAANDGYSPPFFVEGERLTSAGTVFMEDSWSKRISLHIFDYDTPVEDLTVTATTNVPSMLPEENIIVGGVGRFRYIQVKPLAAGYATVTVEVSDGISTVSTSFGVPARTLDDYVPVISDIPDQTAFGGRPANPVEVRLYDLQTTGEPFYDGEQTLALSVTSSDQTLIADDDITVEAVGPRRLIRFTPSATNIGTATLTATVTDDGGLTAVDTFDVTVTTTGTLAVDGGALVTASLGQNYGDSLSASGGVKPFAWSLLSGSLPTGLTLNTDGTFSGTPQATGNFTFTAQVTDGNDDTVSAAFNITVNAWLPLPGNFVLTAEDDSTVTLTWNDDAEGETGYEIQRRKRDYLGWTTLAVTDADATSYNDDTAVAGTHYDYRIRTLGSEPSLWSMPEFIEAQALPSIETQPQSVVVLYLTSPVLNVVAHGGELTYQWYEGQTGDISTPLAEADEKSVTIDAIEFTRSFWVRASNGVGHVDSDTATLTVNQITWPLHLDFGETATLSPDGQGRYWNTIDFYNGSLNSLIDAVGESTEINFVIIEKFWHLWTTSSPATDIYPDTAIQDAARPFNHDAVFKLTGLVPGQNYDLKFFASRSDAPSLDYTTAFVIDNVSQSIDPDANLDTFVIFEKIAADASGEITVTVDPRDSQYGYLNVMELSKSPDPVAMELSATSVSVPEEGTATFDVRLTAQPEDDVTVAIAYATGDSDLSIASDTNLTFTTADWDQWQTVTLQADDDSDTDDGSALFQCTATGLSTVSVTATEADDDLAIWVDPTSLTVAEGSTASFQTRLNTAPQTSCTVDIAHLSGDGSITIDSETSLIFTAGDYDEWQTVTVAAAQDSDQTDGVTIVRLSSATAASADVTVTEQDDDYTIIAEGLLASWNFDGITSSPVVTEAAPDFLADGLTQGLATHSDTSKMRGATNALKAIDSDEASLATAITAGNYFTWSLSLEADHTINVTSIVLRTKADGSTLTLGLLSDATGLTDADVLATQATGVVTTTTAITMEPTIDGIEFRLYGYGAASAYEAVYLGNAFTTDDFDDIQIYGTVAYSSPGPADDDLDELPDDWEIQYFGDISHAPGDPAANTRFTLMDAYVIGLDPTDPHARFALISIDPLQWTGVEGRVYSVEWTDDLTADFQTLQSNISWDATTYQDTVHQDEEFRFYRLSVELAP